MEVPIWRLLFWLIPAVTFLTSWFKNIIWRLCPFTLFTRRRITLTELIFFRKRFIRDFQRRSPLPPRQVHRTLKIWWRKWKRRAILMCWHFPFPAALAVRIIRSATCSVKNRNWLPLFWIPEVSPSAREFWRYGRLWSWRKAWVMMSWPRHCRRKWRNARYFITWIHWPICAKAAGSGLSPQS